jgi:predicted nucleic acid-binding protein
VSFVLDTSVALAWCFEDEQTPVVMDLLDRVTETGATAPALWPLEALNGLLMAERRKRIDSALRGRLMAFLRDLPIILDLDTADRAWTETVGLAERFKLTVYDAAYLEVAWRRRLPIASLDKPLRTAAAEIGIETLGL